MVFMRRHRWALIAGFVVGICAVTPAILAPRLLGDEYHGIQFAPLDDEDIYRSRIHEILDGYGMVGQATQYEYKSAPVTIPPVNEWLYAFPAFVIGLSATLIAAKFMLPAVLFFLAYLLVRRLTDDELTAIAGGLLATFSVEFVDYGYMLSLLHGGFPRPLLWTRPVNPILGGIEVFVFANLLWSVVTKSWKYAPLAAGVVFALSVGYYFSFGTCGALLGGLICVYALRREWDTAVRLMAAGVFGFFLTLPNWYLVLHAVGSRELAMRNGLFFTHAPVVNKLLLLATGICVAAFIYAYKRDTVQRAKSQWTMLLSFLAAGWIAFNEQIITGRDLWHHHFVQYIVPLSALSVVVALFYTFREKLPRVWEWGMIACIAFCLAFVAYTPLQIVPRLSDFRTSQSYGLVMQWLQENAPNECVVLVVDDHMLDRAIPAYSQCNEYVSTWIFSGVPPERLDHNIFTALFFDGVGPSAAEEYLRKHPQILIGTFFEDWNQALMNAPTPWLDAKITDSAGTYFAFATGDVEARLKTYRLDYVVSAGPLLQAVRKQLPHLEERAVVGGWHIYAFTQ